MMLTTPPPPFRKRHVLPKKETAAPRPPGAPLNLVAGSFNPGEQSISLTFDRAINIGAIDVSAIQVNDDLITGDLFDGLPGGASLTAANTLKLLLEIIGSSEGGRVLLTATAMTGIKAVNDGGTWAGVVELGLPFP